jgi:hypothetical protein
MQALCTDSKSFCGKQGSGTRSATSESIIEALASILTNRDHRDEEGKLGEVLHICLTPFMPQALLCQPAVRAPI